MDEYIRFLSFLMQFSASEELVDIVMREKHTVSSFLDNCTEDLYIDFMKVLWQTGDYNLLDFNLVVHKHTKH